jgi:DNA repair exonuclease SbcCD ATPase subunit
LFDRLAVITSDRIKEIYADLKAFNKEDNTKRSADMSIELELLQGKLSDLTNQVNENKDNATTILQLISEEEKKIIKLENVPTNVEALRNEKSTLQLQIENYSKQTDPLKKEIEALKEKMEELKSAIAKYSGYDLDSKFQEATRISDELDNAEVDLERLKTLVQEKIKKLAHLDKHEYDPNCKYCMNNIFVKDAIATRESLKEDKIKATELVSSVAAKKAKLSEYAPFLEMKTARDDLMRRLPVDMNEISTKELKLHNLISNSEKAVSRIAEIDESIELYEKSKEIIETNKVIQGNIDTLTQQHKNQAILLKKCEDEYIKDFARKTSLTDQVNNIKVRIEEIEMMEDEYSAFEYYSQSIGSSGIPYQIISDAVPQIEAEVNNILNQIVEFSVSIETDGKNVNMFINYEDRKWPLELCSGMEQFIASLALRVALINISNLPKSNFMVIDGSLLV